MKIYILDIQIDNYSECYVRDEGFRTEKEALEVLYKMYGVKEDDDDQYFIGRLKDSVKEITIK